MARPVPGCDVHLAKILLYGFDVGRAVPPAGPDQYLQNDGGFMKSILDPTFRYTSSANTDLRKTFARIRRENKKVAQTARTKVEPSNVATIFPRRSGAAS